MPSFLLTTLLAVGVACVVLAGANSTTTESRSTELPAPIREAEAAYEERQLEIEDAILKAGALAAIDGPEARRAAMEHWIEQHADTLAAQNAEDEKLSLLYEHHGLVTGALSAQADAALQEPSAEWADTAAG